MADMIDHLRNAGFERNIAYIIGLGLLLRIIWAFLVPVYPVSDANIYWVTANNIADYGVYGVKPDEPFSYWPVGASAIYAVSLWIFGPGMTGPIFVNVIAGAILIWSSGLLARRWLSEPAGLLTAVIISVWPTLVLYTTIIASEVLFAVAVNLALLFWGPAKDPSSKRGIASGILFGIAALIRPTGAPVVAVIATIDALRTRSIKTRIVPAILAVIAMLMVIAPWSARNTQLYGEFVLISTNGGPNMWMGNHPDGDGGYRPLPDWTKNLNEVERARLLGQQAREFMLENPLRTTTLFFRKMVGTHATETIAVHWNRGGIEKRFGDGAMLPFKVLTQGYWSMVLLSALLGVFGIFRRALKTDTVWEKLTSLAVPHLALWAYFATVHALVVSQDRYHLQSVAFIAMLSASGLLMMFDRLGNRAASKPFAAQGPAE
ncbi:MAG: glycosyltransferase family 39 protein [Parvularcula sp.]|jgi:4-amino-4-deoxy-L-arabinose transferase-like glycosyltransferase|nr:glycosyltransferase family 39 protein [Parvularcula sp.]